MADQIAQGPTPIGAALNSGSPSPKLRSLKIEGYALSTNLRSALAAAALRQIVNSAAMIAAVASK